MDVISLARRTARAHGFCPDSCGRDECDLARALLKAVDVLERALPVVDAITGEVTHFSVVLTTAEYAQVFAELRGATSSWEAPSGEETGC